jgi:hypothetical protein
MHSCTSALVCRSRRMLGEPLCATASAWLFRPRRMAGDRLRPPCPFPCAAASTLVPFAPGTGLESNCPSPRVQSCYGHPFARWSSPWYVSTSVPLNRGTVDLPRRTSYWCVHFYARLPLSCSFGVGVGTGGMLAFPAKSVSLWTSLRVYLRLLFQSLFREIGKLLTFPLSQP